MLNSSEIKYEKILDVTLNVNVMEQFSSIPVDKTIFLRNTGRIVMATLDYFPMIKKMFCQNR